MNLDSSGPLSLAAVQAGLHIGTASQNWGNSELVALAVNRVVTTE